MTSVDHPIDTKPSPDYRIALGAAIVGLIPGFGYLTLFLCGLIGIIDWVWLLSDRLTVWFVPMAIGGLILSIIVGLSSGSMSHRPPGLRTCAWLAVLLMAVDLPLVLVQLVSLFAYYD